MYDVSLESVDLPSAASLGDYAFANCTMLKSLSLGDSFESAGRYSFAYCTNMTDFDIGKSVVSLGTGAFAFDVSLERITSESTVYTVADGVLYENVNTLHTYPAGLAAESFAVPAGVTAIAETAFANASLKTVAASGVRTVGKNAFCRCEKLETVAVPDAEEIGDGAFSYCFCLKNIEVGGSYSFTENILVKDGTLICFAAGGDIAEYIVPNRITAIAYRAFAGCRGLTFVRVNNSCGTIGEEAFCGCTSLKNAYVGSAVVIGKDAFADCDQLILHGGIEAETYARENDIDFS